METYSYSKIKMFHNCKKAFYVRYFENPKELLSHGTSEFGSFVHEILEKYEKGELQIYEMMPYYIEHYDENVHSSFVLNMSKDFSRDFSDSYYAAGLKYLEGFDGFPDFDIIQAEYEFTIPIENKFNFTGKIDLIARDKEGNLIILDHKSKSKFKSKKELAEYAKQLYLYSYAVYKKFGELPKKLYFNMFRTDELIEIPFNNDDYNEAYQWLVKSVDEIENCFDFSELEDKTDFYCMNFCPIREQCRSENIEV